MSTSGKKAVVGYAHLHETLGLRVLPPAVRAFVSPGQRRIACQEGAILVPPRQAPPEGADTLTHVLFALKHEPMNLAILMDALGSVPASIMHAAIARQPGSAYVRTACFLWEKATAAALTDLPPIRGARTRVFDPARYATGPGRVSQKWRIDFNGLGDTDYCPVVSLPLPSVNRTGNTMSAGSLWDRLRAHQQALSPTLRARAQAWSYLHETRSSFAIEHEAPSGDRAASFARLLRQVHAHPRLDEEALVTLQNAIVDNPRLRAFSFRTTQNWLQGPLQGPLGVTYVPPPPDLARSVLAGLARMSETAPGTAHPMALAAALSFGFVFAHPFEDGNGRLSRFLIHHALARAGCLDEGCLLPVSMAMQRHEEEYLEALQAFSAPARSFWKVLDVGCRKPSMTFIGSPSLYRYWDATPATAFLSRMAEEAFAVDVRGEADWLVSYDAIVRAVSAEHDLRSSTLATLVAGAMASSGVVSKRRRDQFRREVPEAAFAAIEQATRAAMHRQPRAGQATGKVRPSRG